MLNCDLSAICCCSINFSGCTFGARDAAAAGGNDDVVTRLGRRVEDCDMRGCTFNGFKFGGEWVKVISTSHVTRHTSHVTRHTSHVTRHTSHSPGQPAQHALLLCLVQISKLHLLQHAARRARCVSELNFCSWWFATTMKNCNNWVGAQ